MQDVYPDVGEALGVFTSPHIRALISLSEAVCMRSARLIQVLSPAFARTYEAKGVGSEKIRVLPNWCDTEQIYPQPRSNPFSDAWDLEGVFVVMYAGNIGQAQGLENVIDAAQMLEHVEDVRFVFVGDGPGLGPLKKQASRPGVVANVTFIDRQAPDQMAMVLGASDVSLVPLRPGVSAQSLPSKCYAIMASGRPILAVTEPGSATAELLESAACGVTCTPDSPRALADAVMALRADPQRRHRMGQNGRAHVVEHNSRRAAVARWRELILDAGRSAPLRLGT